MTAGQKIRPAPQVFCVKLMPCEVVLIEGVTTQCLAENELSELTKDQTIPQ